MITYQQSTTSKQLGQILELQQENLPKNLTKNEMHLHGFLTVEHSMEMLHKMNRAFPHTIALYEERVIGYALSMHPKFENEIEVLKSMFDKIGEVYHGNSFLVMGQICIARPYRGQGLFKELYQNMQKFTDTFYEDIITEVDLKNKRSIRAHKSVGFEELTRYKSGGQEWSLLKL